MSSFNKTCINYNTFDQSNHQYLIKKNIKINTLKQILKTKFYIDKKNVFRRFLIGFCNKANQQNSLERIDEDSSKKMLGSSKCKFSCFNFSINEYNKLNKFIVCSGFADGYSIAQAFPDHAVLCCVGENQIHNIAIELANKYKLDLKNILCIADNDVTGQIVLDECINSGFEVSRTSSFKDASDLFCKYDVNHVKEELKSNINNVAVRSINKYSTFDYKKFFQNKSFSCSSFQDIALKIKKNQEERNYIALCDLESTIINELYIHKTTYSAKRAIYAKYSSLINIKDLDLYDKRIDTISKKIKSDLENFTELSIKKFDDVVSVVYRDSIGNFDFNKHSMFISCQKMGSGKTRDVAKKMSDQSKSNGEFVAVVLHLKSLCLEISNVLDTDHYSNSKALKTKNLTTCVPSVVSNNNVVDSFLSRCSNAPNLLILDEFTQIINFLNSKNCNPCHYYKVCELIRNADKIYAADANFSNYDVDMLFKIRNNPNDKKILIETEEKSYKERFEKFMHIKSNADVADIYSQILIETENKTNIICACDTKAQADNIYNYLTKIKSSGFGVPVNKILLLTKDTKRQNKEFFKNPNEYSKKFKIIIYSPVVVSGISIVNNHFQKIIAVSSSYLPASDHLQQIARNRVVQDVYSYIIKKPKRTIISFDEYEQAADICLNFLSGKQSSLTSFDEFSLSINAKNSILQHYYQSYLYKLASKSGYKLIFNNNDSVLEDSTKDIKESLKQLKASQKEQLLKDISEVELTVAESKKLNNYKIENGDCTDEEQLKYYKLLCSNSLGVPVNLLTLKDVLFWNFGESSKRLSNHMLITTSKTYSNTNQIKNITKLPKSALIKKIYKKLFKDFDDKTVIDDSYSEKKIKAIRKKCYRPILAFLKLIEKSHLKVNIKMMHDLTCVDDFECERPKKFIKNIIKNFGYELKRSKNPENGENIYIVDKVAQKQINHYISCKIALNELEEETEEQREYIVPDEIIESNEFCIIKKDFWCISKDNDLEVIKAIQSLNEKQKLNLIDIHIEHVGNGHIYISNHDFDLYCLYQKTKEYKENYNLDYNLAKYKAIEKIKKNR